MTWVRLEGLLGCPYRRDVEADNWSIILILPYLGGCRKIREPKIREYTEECLKSFGWCGVGAEKVQSLSSVKIKVML